MRLTIARGPAPFTTPLPPMCTSKSRPTIILPTPSLRTPSGPTGLPSTSSHTVRVLVLLRPSTAFHSPSIHSYSGVGPFPLRVVVLCGGAAGVA